MPDLLRYTGDDAWDSLHLGAYVDRELVGIASVVHETPPGEVGERAWRIRGMAVVEPMRGRGYGRALLERCVHHAQGHGATSVWCNARVGAVGFYRRCGFEVEGDRFDVPQVGPHYFMRRSLK